MLKRPKEDQSDFWSLRTALLEGRAVCVRIYKVKDEFMKDNGLLIDHNEVFGDTITIQGSKLDQCIEYINEHNLDSVYVWDWKYDKEDLSFLRECPSVRKLNIGSCHIERVDSLKQLTMLEELVLDTRKMIDIGMLGQLKSVSGDYKKLKGLEKLTKLKTLALWNYAPKTADFSELQTLVNLGRLELNFAKIKTLGFIEVFGALKALELHGSRYLKNIDALTSLSGSLLDLRIDECKNISSYDVLQSMEALQNLALCDDGNIESIKFIEPLQNLDSFIFVGTNIIDGDMSYCKELNHVAFTNKKHYSHKEKEFTKSCQ